MNREDIIRMTREGASMIPLPQGYEPHELPADYTGKLWQSAKAFARAIEAAHGIKQGGQA